MKFREAAATIGFDVDAFLAAPRPPLWHRQQRTHVYMLTCDRYVKIGVSRDVARRIGNLMLACPIDIHLGMYRTYPTFQYALLCERTCHRLLSSHYHRMEWFDVDVGHAKLVLRTVSKAMGMLMSRHLAIRAQGVQYADGSEQVAEMEY